LKRQKNCIIIGAGLAGLSAGYDLAKKGWRVDVLEALDRTGGRVLSHRFDQTSSVVCELGAEWIGENHRRMQKLCDDFKLPLQKHQYSISFWDGVTSTGEFKPGQWPFSPEARGAFRKLKARYKKARKSKDGRAALDRDNWWNALESAGFPLGELPARDLMDSTDFGETIRLTSAFLAAAEYFDGDDTDEMDFKIAGGNSRLLGELASFIRDSGQGYVHVNAMVTRIEQSGGQVKVYVNGLGAPFTADYCICTVPAPCLKRIAWNPVPETKLAAACQLQYARIMKTAVLYAERFWPHDKKRKSGFSVFTGRASDFCFDSTFGQPGPYGILCSYAIGDKADDLASEPSDYKLMRWISEDAARSVGKNPETEVAALAVKRQPWQKELWIGGAYAFYLPGQWFTLRSELESIFQRVHFAGEHLSEDWQGFMEGAVETGQAAAKKVMQRAAKGV
jgi:monoamine oxidase